MTKFKDMNAFEDLKTELSNEIAKNFIARLRDSGVSDVTSDDSSGSQLVLSQKHLARWDSGVSDCSHITAASLMKKSSPHQDMIRFATSECFSISKCQTKILGNYF